MWGSKVSCSLPPRTVLLSNQISRSYFLLPAQPPDSPHSSNCDTLVSGLTFHTSCQGPHLGWLQFSEAWQLVNKKTRDVNHGLRQFPVGQLLSSHQIFSLQYMKRRPMFPSDTNANIDQRETGLGTGREREGSL